MTDQEPAQPVDNVPPTLVLSIMPDGDVEIGTAQGQQMNTFEAMALMELAKAKLISMYFGGIMQQRAQQAATKQPHLYLPR